MTDRIDDLNQLHPILKTKILLLLKLAKEAGLNVDVFETYRTPERSNMLYDKGTGAKAGYSYHNYNLACDIVFKNDKGWTWDSKDWIKLGEIGKSIGLDWGGDWTMRDCPHFQLTFDLTIKDLQAGKKPPVLDKYIQWALDSELISEKQWYTEKPTWYESIVFANRLVKYINNQK